MIYKFTKNVYNIWMSTHFKRICSIIDQLLFNLDFKLLQQFKLQFSEESGLFQELEGHHLSQQANTDSTSLREEDSQSSRADSQDVIPNTSLSQRIEHGLFKKPKKRHAAA